MNISLLLLVFGIGQIGMSVYNVITILTNNNLNNIVEYYIIIRIVSNFISGLINILFFFYKKYEYIKYILFIINSIIGFLGLIIYYKNNILVDEIKNLLLIETLLSLISLIIFIIFYSYKPRVEDVRLTTLVETTIES